MKRMFIAALTVAAFAVTLPIAADAAMQIRKKPTEGAEPAPAAPAAAPASAPAAAPAAAPADSPKPAAAASPAEGKAAPAQKAEAPKPAPKPAQGAASPAEKGKIEGFIGAVGFVQGKKVLVESSAEISPRQRLIAYDERVTKRGVLKVTSAKGKGLFLATVTSGSVNQGDRLVKETEEDAFARVSRSRKPETVKEFLEVYPDSPHRQDIALRLFRIALRSDFPVASGGSRISGKVLLGEKVGQKIEMGRAMVKLDRFLIAMTDEEGRFDIDGLPQLVLPVTVSLAVADPKFQTGEDITVDIAAEKSSTLEKDIRVSLTPTHLVGKVVDEKGHPVKGAQVWTSPYTMEKLSDENGEFRISRKKKLDDSGNPMEGDEPLLGRDYEVYAYKSGYGAEKIGVSAESFKENAVKAIIVTRQGTVEASLPPPQVGLRENLDLMQYVVSAGSGPKINR